MFVYKNKGLIEKVSEVINAFVVGNAVYPVDMPGLIASVYAAFDGLCKSGPKPQDPKRMVSSIAISRSFTDDYLISFEDGRHYQTLKRHLRTRGLTPALYRAKWGLPIDYPMIAPAYAAKQSRLAKERGFGRRSRPAA